MCVLDIVLYCIAEKRLRCVASNGLGYCIVHVVVLTILLYIVYIVLLKQADMCFGYCIVLYILLYWLYC